MDLPSAIFSAACRWQLLFELTWLVPGLGPELPQAARLCQSQVRSVERQRAAATQLEGAGADVDFYDMFWVTYEGPDWLKAGSRLIADEWCDRFFDVREISLRGKVDHAALDLRLFGGVPHLTGAWLFDHPVSTADLDVIGQLKELEELGIAAQRTRASSD